MAGTDRIFCSDRRDRLVGLAVQQEEVGAELAAAELGIPRAARRLAGGDVRGELEVPLGEDVGVVAVGLLDLAVFAGRLAELARACARANVR